MKKHMIKLLLLMALQGCSAAAMSQGYPADAYRLNSRGTRLAQVLKDLGAHYSMSVMVSKKIDDVFVGTLQEPDPEQALKRLGSLYGLAWYFDGEVLHVYKTYEVATELLTPTYLSAVTLQDALTEQGHADERFCRLRPIKNGNVIEVFGVPACIDRLTRLVKRLDEQNGNLEQNQEVMKVFPLRYANANDGGYSFRGQNVTVPGVMSVLKDMLQGRMQTASNSAKEASMASFAVDTRQNAVIVRDRKINMKLYEGLIPQLDIKPVLVEVSVAIIDVDAGDLNALGMDWSASAKLGGGRISFNSGGIPDSGGFTAVVNNTENFMLKLTALEQHSKAKVLSRPSLVTLNNVQAVLDRSITFYTKVYGEKVARLESMSTGSLLRVTPRLVQENGQQEVMLTLNIQDGQQDKAVSEMETLPQVRNSEIATQATLKAGQSLLLGGFVQDAQTEGERRIPLLSDLPILGNLFKNKTTSMRSVIRLFLIKAEPVITG